MRMPHTDRVRAIGAQRANCQAGLKRSIVRAAESRMPEGPGAMPSARALVALADLLCIPGTDHAGRIDRRIIGEVVTNDRPLLTQNSQMKREGIYNFSLPALAARLEDGRTVKVCRTAGSCAPLCYARVNAYAFPGVKAAHTRNLTLIIDDLPRFEERMTAEVQHERMVGRNVRIHDSGEFFSTSYLEAWLRIMRNTPEVNFYTYTKEVSLFREIVEPDPPGNFKWVYSLGGWEDGLIDINTDRHAEVFPDADAVEAAGYHDQTASDLLAVYGPPKVGIPANNIPKLKRKQGRETFGSLQKSLERDRIGKAKGDSVRHGLENTERPPSFAEKDPVPEGETP